MGMNPERESSMNVVNYPLMGFKEFGAYQPQYIEPSIPVLESGSSRRVGSIFDAVDVTNPFTRNFRESLPVETLMASTRYENSRAAPGFRFPDTGRSHHRAAWGHAANEDTASADSMRLDAKSLQKQFQSTELTIQTRDGDTVTIRIQERSVQKENSQVKVSNTNRDAAESAAMVVQQEGRSGEALNLSGVFEEESVSDVNYQRNWATQSEASTQINRVADGVSTEATYRTQSYTVGSLQFEVDGTLDQEELQAIHDLVKGVGALSESFFNGDMTQAFKQATQLGYDSNEIAGYSLELRDRELNVAEQKYRAASELAQPELPKGMFRAIGDYAQQLMTLKELDQEQFSGRLLDQLMKRVDTNRERFDDSYGNDGRASRVFRGRDHQIDDFSEFNRNLYRQIQELILS